MTENKSNSKCCWEHSEKRQETGFQTWNCRQGLLPTERPEIPSKGLRITAKKLKGASQDGKEGRKIRGRRRRKAKLEGNTENVVRRTMKPQVASTAPPPKPRNPNLGCSDSTPNEGDSPLTSGPKGAFLLGAWSSSLASSAAAGRMLSPRQVLAAALLYSHVRCC